METFLYRENNTICRFLVLSGLCGKGALSVSFRPIGKSLESPYMFVMHTYNV